MLLSCKCVQDRSPQTHKMIFLPSQWRNSLSANSSQKAELEAPEAPHRQHHLLVSHGHIQDTLIQKIEKHLWWAFSNPEQVGEEKEKLPLVSWFRLSEEFSVLYMPHLLLANRYTTRVFNQYASYKTYFKAIFLRVP